MKRLSFLILLMFAGFLANAQMNPTPIEILKKTVSKINDSKGVDANFTVSGSGYTGSGVIKTAGKKFKVTLPEVEVWYNGNDLYTLNKRTSETTVVQPTVEELAESNPLSYINNAGNQYNVTFSTVKKNGKYVLELTPKSKGEIKRITLTINKSDYKPEKLVVEPMRGTPVKAEITSLQTNTNISAVEFEYPKSKYPKVEIIDLR